MKSMYDVGEALNDQFQKILADNPTVEYSRYTNEWFACLFQMQSCALMTKADDLKKYVETLLGKVDDLPYGIKYIGEFKKPAWDEDFEKRVSSVLGIRSTPREIPEVSTKVLHITHPRESSLEYLVFYRRGVSRTEIHIRKIWEQGHDVVPSNPYPSRANLAYWEARRFEIRYSEEFKNTPYYKVYGDGRDVGYVSHFEWREDILNDNAVTLEDTELPPPELGIHTLEFMHAFITLEEAAT